MTNKNNPIKQKEAGERNKEIWILKDKDKNIIETYRSHQLAKKELKRKEKESWGEEFYLDRDNSYRENLKEVLNGKKRKV